MASCVSASEPEIVASVLVAAAYTFPFASTPRPELEREVNHCVPVVRRVVDAAVDDASSKTAVDDAKSETGEPVRCKALVVALTFACPHHVSCVNGSPMPPPVGHEVRQSVERQSVPAESAVEEANGNTDAAAVEEAKKTPAVWMEDEVAADVVP